MGDIVWSMAGVHPVVVRALVVALACAVSVSVALIAAILSWIARPHLAEAALRAGAAFAGAFGLALAVLAALKVL